MRISELATLVGAPTRTVRHYHYLDVHPDSTVSPEMAGVLRDLPAEGSKSAEIDRELPALMDTEVSLAQAEVFRLVMIMLRERG